MSLISNGYRLKSSQISIVGFDKQLSELTVVFDESNASKIEVYKYSNVNVNIFDELMKATSHGKYFISKIKNKPNLFPWKKLVSDSLNSIFREIVEASKYIDSQNQYIKYDWDSPIDNTSWCW
jgi:hypothetical protein